MGSLWNAVMEDDVEMLKEMVRFGEIQDLSKLSDCGNGLMVRACSNFSPSTPHKAAKKRKMFTSQGL